MTTSWVDQIENGNGAGNFIFKIDDTFFFLIDNTFNLIIQSGTPSSWTDQVEN